MLVEGKFKPVTFKTEYFNYKKKEEDIPSNLYHDDTISDRVITSIAVGNNELWVVFDNDRLFGALGPMTKVDKISVGGSAGTEITSTKYTVALTGRDIA